MYRKQHNLDGNSSSAPRRRSSHHTNYDDRKPTVSFRIPADMKEDLERDLDALGMSKAEFLRMVVRDFVSRRLDVRFDERGKPYLLLNERR